jgi:hypothetical protein
METKQLDENIIDIEATIQYQRDSKLNHVLDGCHSL